LLVCKHYRLNINVTRSKDVITINSLNVYSRYKNILFICWIKYISLSICPLIIFFLILYFFNNTSVTIYNRHFSVAFVYYSISLSVSSINNSISSLKFIYIRLCKIGNIVYTYSTYFYSIKIVCKFIKLSNIIMLLMRIIYNNIYRFISVPKFTNLIFAFSGNDGFWNKFSANVCTAVYKFFK